MRDIAVMLTTMHNDIPQATEQDDGWLAQLSYAMIIYWYYHEDWYWTHVSLLSLFTVTVTIQNNYQLADMLLTCEAIRDDQERG